MNIDRSVARECKHTEQRVASDEVQYDVSCYHELHCLRVRESRRQGTQEQQQGRLSNTSQPSMIEWLKSSNHLTWRTSTNTLSVIALLQETMDTTDRELETGFGRTRLRLCVTARSFTTLRFSSDFARHCNRVECSVDETLDLSGGGRKKRRGRGKKRVELVLIWN